MMIPQRLTFFNPAQMTDINGTTTAASKLCGTIQKFAIDRTWPIEEIIVLVDVVMGSGTNTLHNADTANSLVDSILGIVKNINLSINDGIQPRSVVDFSGPGLLEYASLVGLNLDRSTWEAVRLSQLLAITASDKLRIAYRIPLVHPLIGEPLRTRMLLPAHIFPQDPILTITYESNDNMLSGTNHAVNGITTSIILVRRAMTKALTDAIVGSGGFIGFDILETPNTFAPGVSGEQRLAIPITGSYMNLCCRQYLGGAAIVRDVIDQTTTQGAESRWRLESGGVVLRDWRWKFLQTLNDFSRPALVSQVPTVGTGFIAATSGGAVTTALTNATSGVVPQSQFLANFGGAVASATHYQPASSTLLDFLTDGLGAEGANELGSVLDCNIPANSGLKMEIIGPVASVATYGSTLYIGGHRLYGDLSRWQAQSA